MRKAFNLDTTGKIMTIFVTFSFSSWQRVFHSIISTRILLHIRASATDYRTVDTEEFELGVRFRSYPRPSNT